jgi:UDP-N-acetylglucosamine 3-dehydrogenase
MKKLKLAIVGLGVMGCNHLRVLNEMENVEVVAICDVDKERLKKLKRLYKIKKVHVDVVEMLKSESLDGLIVSAPTVSHYDLAKLAIHFNIPVLIEKPLALEINQGQEIVKEAKNKGLLVFVGYVERFNPTVLRMKELIEQEICGKPLHINLSRVNHFPLRMAKRHIGVVTDLSTHDTDLIQYITGKKIVNLMAKLKFDGGHDVYANVQFELEDQITAICEWSWISAYRRRILEVVCEKGTLVGDLAKQILYFHENPVNLSNQPAERSLNFLEALEFGNLSGKMTQYVLKKEEPLRLELQKFVATIVNKENYDSQYAVQVIEIMEAIYKSSEQDQIVRIDNTNKKGKTENLIEDYNSIHPKINDHNI